MMSSSSGGLSFPGHLRDKSAAEAFEPRDVSFESLFDERQSLPLFRWYTANSPPPHYGLEQTRIET